MNLPEEIAEQFDHELEEFEKENKMTYVTTIERRGIQKGIEKGIHKGEQKTLREDVLEILELRFFSVPYAIKEQLKEINDTTELRRLLRLAVQTESIDTFTQGIREKC